MFDMEKQSVEVNEANAAGDVSVTAGQSTDETIENPGTYLASLIERRSTWECGAYKASNDALYVILGDCLRLYYYVSDTTSEERIKARVSLREQIAKIAKERGIRFLTDTHLATKIVRCVFETDRKRASTYSIVVRAAITNKIAADDLPTFIREQSGIENIRLKKRDPDGSKARKAKEVVRAKLAGSSNVGEIVGVNTQLIGASAKRGDINVAIVEWQTDGKFAVKWIGQSQVAIDSALAAFNRSQKEGESVASNDGDVLENVPANDPVALESAA